MAKRRKKRKKSRKWIQEMHMNKGGLHRSLHMALDTPIPTNILKKAAEEGTTKKFRRRARLALTLRKLRKN